MKTTAERCFFVALFIFFLYSNSTFAALTFNCTGFGTSYMSSISCKKINTPDNSNVKATNIIGFDVTHSSTNQPSQITSLASYPHTARYAATGSKRIIYKVSDFQTRFSIIDAIKVNYDGRATQSSGMAIILLFTIQS